MTVAIQKITVALGARVASWGFSMSDFAPIVVMLLLPLLLLWLVQVLATSFSQTKTV